MSLLLCGQAWQTFLAAVEAAATALSAWPTPLPTMLQGSVSQSVLLGTWGFPRIHWDGGVPEHTLKVPKASF